MILVICVDDFWRLHILQCHFMKSVKRKLCGIFVTLVAVICALLKAYKLDCLVHISLDCLQLNFPP